VTKAAIWKQQAIPEKIKGLDKHLHIISLTVPYPVDYGGVFDLFYKLPALQQQGVKIHLHCFDYGRGEQNELNKYCLSVHYYQRSQASMFSSLPYIVSSRTNEELFEQLLNDDHPILMEGVHCTSLVNDKRFATRNCFVRLHNVEFEYYRDLASVTSSLLKKAYLKRESKLLKRYESDIANKATFFSVTDKDAVTYRHRFNCRRISHLPLFLPDWKVDSKEGVGAYCLYQGDLSVAANSNMAEWLIKNVFAGSNISLKIAGKKPPVHLTRIISKHDNIALIADPTEQEMQELISNAHINIIPSFSNTGIKLKLLNALFNGRHCLVNNATVEGIGFEQLCHVANSAEHIKDLVSQLYHQPFRTDEITERKSVLQQHFNNERNAKKLVEMIWG
jgi:hypothetical protein